MLVYQRVIQSHIIKQHGVRTLLMLVSFFETFVFSMAGWNEDSYQVVCGFVVVVLCGFILIWQGIYIYIYVYVISSTNLIWWKNTQFHNVHVVCDMRVSHIFIIQSWDFPPSHVKLTDGSGCDVYINFHPNQIAYSGPRILRMIVSASVFLLISTSLR